MNIFGNFNILLFKGIMNQNYMPISPYAYAQFDFVHDSTTIN